MLPDRIHRSRSFRLPSHRRYTPAALALAVGLAHACTLSAQRSAPSETPRAGTVSVIPPVPIDTFTLSNGLSVVVSEDHSSPVVAVSMWYRVGSADEEEGRTGLAHLFEHLLFQETEHLAEGEMDRLVTRAGGLYNATTDVDRTAYHEVLPANRLNLALWLHAERMDRVRLTQSALDTQREVVKEERRLRIENQPYGPAQVALDTASQDYVPYRHPAIGSMEDLDAARLQDVQAFYARFYAPSNAVLTVVGDVTPEAVRAMAERYLGPIERGGRAPVRAEPPTPPRAGERRLVMEDPFARLPLVWYAYTVPSADHPDRQALELLSEVLAGGESSRLSKRLVDTEAAAQDVVSQMDLRIGPGTLRMGGLPNEGVGTARLEELLDDEIGRLQRDGITGRELTKAVNARRSALVTELLTVESKADLLQWHTFHEGSPFRLNDEMRRYESVTTEDVRRVARTYLAAANRTVVVAVPPSGDGS